MTLTVEVPPYVEAGVLSQAQAEGLDIPRYVERLLYRQAMAHRNGEVFRPAADLSSEERLGHLLPPTSEVSATAKPLLLS